MYEAKPDLDTDYCDNCGVLADLAWVARLGGNLCPHCQRLAGRSEVIVHPWERRPDTFAWEPLAPPAQKYLVAFDVDDTIWDWTYNGPDPAVVGLVRAFAALPNVEVIIWSYGGEQHARNMSAKAGVDEVVDHICGKQDWAGRLPDLFVDDNGIGVPGGKTWLYVGDETIGGTA